MRYISVLPVLLLGAAVSACTPAPAVNDSREVLWQQYGNKPLDTLLIAWGVPNKETHLSDGSRLVTYRHATTYEARTAYERGSQCEVSFMAKPDKFLINDIAMQGSARECSLLAKGKIGEVVVPAPEPVYPYGTYPYRSYAF